MADEGLLNSWTVEQLMRCSQCDARFRPRVGRVIWGGGYLCLQGGSHVTNASRQGNTIAGEPIQKHVYCEQSTDWVWSCFMNFCENWANLSRNRLFRRFSSNNHSDAELRPRHYLIFLRTLWRDVSCCKSLVCLSRRSFLYFKIWRCPNQNLSKPNRGERKITGLSRCRS